MKKNIIYINCATIITEERVGHIFFNHNKDFARIIIGIEATVDNPDFIVIDVKHKNTIFYIKHFYKYNQNVVVKLSRSKKYKNSIISSWIINNKNLRILIMKNIPVYKKK